MTTDRAWQPATELGQALVCQRPGCGREFTPKAPGDVFCSGRCAGLAGVAARNAAVRPLPIDRSDPKPKGKRPKAATCALPGCEEPVQQHRGEFTIPTGNGVTFKHCSREHAEVHAQARAAAAEGAGPTKLAEVLGLPAPFLSLPTPQTATTDPEPEPAAAPPHSSEEAPVPPDPLTTDDQATPTPAGGPPDDPGHVATRTINLTGGGWVSLTLAIDLFALDPAERGLVFDLVDAVNRYQHVQEVRA